MLFAFVAAAAKAADVEDCGSISSARPHVGVAYRGKVENGDYQVTVTVPPGLTGWGGVAEMAPFHGFVVFLPGETESCMDFEIALRVDDDDAPKRNRESDVVSIGNMKGLKEERTGLRDRISWTNVILRFSVRLPDGRVNDGSFTLATPTAKRSRNLRVFQDFVSRTRFEGEDEGRWRE